MIRFLALILLAASASVASAAQPRNFTITSFDRIRVEAPFDVTLTTGRAPSARAEGMAAALDSVDLRVEGRTLIVRQRSGWNGSGKNAPVRLSLATPDLRGAILVGSGRLTVDRLKSMTVTLALAGPGMLKVGDLRADRMDLLAAGSGSVELAGLVKKGRIGAEGTVVVDAAALQSEELVIQAAANSEVRALATSTANLSASGAATVTLGRPVACIQRISGSATVSGCR